MRFAFDADVWVWDARQADTWTFVSLPAEASAEIREFAAGMPRGFGSVRVGVTVGATTWRTSVFPSTAEGVYVLPLKKAVRHAEGIGAGDRVRVNLELLD